jgi:hypothetical protein
MFHSLLLQTTTATQGTPISAYVTIGAAVLAALASLNATRVSAKTTREVASISSQTASESARIAAETAREIKETDYKHDFYKRIIAKRLAAWEEATGLINEIKLTVSDSKDKTILPRYCLSTKAFEEVTTRLRDMYIGQHLWISKEYSAEFFKLYNLNMTIKAQASPDTKDDEISPMDSKLLIEIGKKRFHEFPPLTNNLLRILGRQLGELHDVESFIQQVKTVRGLASGRTISSSEK